MPRTKTGITRRQRHKKVLKLTKGFRGTNRRLYKRAKEALLHSGQYAYIGRRLRKRDLRRLWILRVGIALKNLDPKYNYSRFINALKKAKIQIDRKLLAELAVNFPNAFNEVIKAARR